MERDLKTPFGRSPEILDVTLRDGSYAIGFGFTTEDTRRITSALEDVGFRWIEVGHGLGLNASNAGKGGAAASDEEYLAAAAESIQQANWGMFCIPGVARLKDLDLASRFGMSFVRVGCNITEIEEARPFIERAKELGFFVSYNAMKSYAVSPEEFGRRSALARSWGVDIVDLVDSAGCMFPSDVTAYCEAAREASDGYLGFHAHDNLSLAMANSLAAIEAGAILIDSSLQGMGRSAGNTVTEALVAVLKRQGHFETMDLNWVLDVGQRLVAPLLKGGGLDPLAVTSGYTGFHSSFTPEVAECAMAHGVDVRDLIERLTNETVVHARPDDLDRLGRDLADGGATKRRTVCASSRSRARSLETVPEPATVALADRARRLAAEGRRLIPLQTGDPDFPTPAPIIEAAHRALLEGETHYSHSRGLPVLREAISERLTAAYGATYSTESEVLVTSGAVHAYYCALRATLDPGDEILIPDPSWATHSSLALVVGGTPVRVPAGLETGFFPTIEALERATTARTRALVVNSPSNPAGMVADQVYLEEVSRFATRRGLYVISDETYERILYDGRKHTCFATLPDAKDRTLLVRSLSKTYAMTGWRIGSLAAPNHLIDLALKASQHSITHVAPFIQCAAAFALSDPDVESEVVRMVATYETRRNRALQIWESYEGSPIKLPRPQGAFYLFLDARALRIPSTEIAERILEETGVVVVPGSAFGPVGGEGFLRATTAAADAVVEEGCQAILDWAERYVEGQSSR